MQRAKERAELRKAKAPFKVKQAKADAKDEEEKERFNAINASEAPRRAMPSSEEKGFAARFSDSIKASKS